MGQTPSGPIPLPALQGERLTLSVNKEKTHVTKELEELFKKQAIQRKKIIAEFIQTERTYITNLMILQERFIKPLKKVLPKSDIKLMFGQIETVIGVNLSLVRQLEHVNQMDEPIREPKLADLLITYAHSFKLYTGYIMNYYKSRDAIQKTCEKNPKVAKLLSEITQSLKAEKFSTHDLGSYLILPVQRVPRYRLMLEELLKNTHTELTTLYEKTKRARDSICSVAEYCNEKQREIENLEKLTQIQTKLGLKVFSCRLY